MENNTVLFKALSENELVSITKKIFGESAVQKKYELLKGGLFNTTYRIVTETSDVILRVGPVHRELLQKYEENLMEAEVLVDRLCLENGIPASKVVFIDCSKTIVDRDFMAVERIESKPLSDPSIEREEYPPVFKECGAILKKMHGIKGEKFGRAADVVADKGSDTWYGALKFELDCLFEKAAAFNVFTDEIIKKSYEFLKENEKYLADIKEPKLIHADLWRGNVLVKGEKGSYRVVAIIDGDRAIFGDTDWDITTGWMMTESFKEGYGLHKDYFENERKMHRKEVYILVQSLLEMYIRLVQYPEPENFEYALSKVKEILKF